MAGQEEYLSVAVEAVRAAAVVVQDWVGRIEVRHKGPADLVTQADLASQQTIRRIVLGAFPEHHLLGEEGPADSVAARSGLGPPRNGRLPLDRRSGRRHHELRPWRAALLHFSGIAVQRRGVSRRRLRSGTGRMFHGLSWPRGLAQRPPHPHQRRYRAVRGAGRSGLSHHARFSMHPICGCFSICCLAAKRSAVRAVRR